MITYRQQCKTKQGVLFAALALLVIFATPGMAQNLVQPASQTLTRGKMWIASYETAAVLPGNLGCTVAYPGYYSTTSNPNNYQKPSISLIAKKGGENLTSGPGYLDGGNTWFAIEGKTNSLMKNYNFTLDSQMPEEVMYGEAMTVDPNTADDSHPLIYQMRTRRMAWGLPRYDDFVITQVTVINRDTEEFTDLYLCLYRVMAPTAGGWAKGFENDTEYRWDDDINTFIFYDGTSWPHNAEAPIQYSIEPGITTGDVGDPGNIREVGSIDRRLYSPQAVADGFIDCTPNKNGQKKFWFEIRNSRDDGAGFSIDSAPAIEEVNWQGADYDYLFNIFTHEAPKMSWREAHDQNLPGAGNTYERTPNYFTSVGPYDIVPGDSIQVVFLTCGGDWNREVTMKGGLEATGNLPDSSIAELKKNWQAALDLYQGWQMTGNWNSAITSYPPPSVGNVPLAGNEDVLEVSVFAEAGVGQGYDLYWIPVPDEYQDPLKGTNDVAGYRIYRSEIGLEGPWELQASITVAEAEKMTEGDRVHYRVQNDPGIPSRFAVTSYDSDGLESARTAYNYYALSAPSAPSNQLSNVMVVPNPFRQVSGLLDPVEEKRLAFINIPSQCTIRIYTTAGELVQTIKHNGFGEATWGSSTNDNYMLTRFAMNVMPGVYFYHVTSQVSGHEGESATGKFIIIK